MSRKGGESSLVEHVHRELREDILDGRYAPGTHLRLAELASEHGVSFIPIREALRRLEAERLVDVERNRGARVAALSLDDAHDVYATRIVIEAHALRLAFPRLTAVELERSATAIDAMTELFEAGRSREAYAQHRIVHFSIYEAADSPWTLHVIGQLWAGAERYVRRSAALRGTPQEFAAEHRAVVAAVEAGDVDAAVLRLEEHLGKTQALLERIVEQTMETR